jgi:hypothetical protein
MCFSSPCKGSLNEYIPIIVNEIKEKKNQAG